MFQKIWEALKKAGVVVVDAATGTYKFIDSNKATISAILGVIVPLVPAGSVVYYAVLILGILLTGKSIVNMPKTKQLNGKKTIIASSALYASQIPADVHSYLLFIVLFVAGVVGAIIGIVHKWFKKEITLPTKLQRK